MGIWRVSGARGGVGHLDNDVSEDQSWTMYQRIRVGHCIRGSENSPRQLSTIGGSWRNAGSVWQSQGWPGSEAAPRHISAWDPGLPPCQLVWLWVGAVRRLPTGRHMFAAMYLHRRSLAVVAIREGIKLHIELCAIEELHICTIAYLHNCTFVQLKNCIFAQGITSWASSAPSCRCHVSLTGRRVAADHTVEMWTFRNCSRVQGYYYCQWQL